MAILRRIKENLKKILEKKKKSPPQTFAPRSVAQRILAKKIVKEVSIKKKEIFRKEKIKVPTEKKEEILGMQEMVVEKTKYPYPEAARVVRPMPEELPSQYGQDKIVVQVRDPWWIHAYWEITPDTFNRLKQELQDTFFKAKRTLRLYDISHIIFDGTNAHRLFDIKITPEANNWYIDTGGPGRSWCVDLGLLLPDGRFKTIVRSNTVTTPIEGPSWITDEEWMIPEEMFARLYGMGFGLGRSSPVGKAWQERIKRELFSGVLASPGISSVMSPVKKIPKERKFWLLVNTELIVYGTTEPDAKVYVQNKEIKLRADGTFTLRFALPDGKQVMPVKAISADNAEERTITPIVTKETK